MIASLFGMEDIKQVRIKPFINEDKHLLSLYREHKQRDVIIEGWKELGMQPEDIGIITDLDERSVAIIYGPYKRVPIYRNSNITNISVIMNR